MSDCILLLREPDSAHDGPRYTAWQGWMPFLRIHSAHLIARKTGYAHVGNMRVVDNPHLIGRVIQMHPYIEARARRRFKHVGTFDLLIAHPDATCVMTKRASCGPAHSSGSSSWLFGVRWSEALEERLAVLPGLERGANFGELRALLHTRPSLTDPAALRARRVWRDQVQLMAMLHDKLHGGTVGCDYAASSVPQAYHDRIALEWRDVDEVYERVQVSGGSR